MSAAHREQREEPGALRAAQFIDHAEALLQEGAIVHPPYVPRVGGPEVSVSERTLETDARHELVFQHERHPRRLQVGVVQEQAHLDDPAQQNRQRHGLREGPGEGAEKVQAVSRRGPTEAL